MHATSKYQVIADRDSRYDGVFFFAVKTTGIVCCPSCPAPRPLEKNVVFYNELDEALRNGFRACKRCRPEQISESIIEQSVGLLEANSTVQAARKLGITDRQLRRITRQQIGTSSHKLLQSRRILTAKNLLANTELPIELIAYLPPAAHR